MGEFAWYYKLKLQLYTDYINYSDSTCVDKSRAYTRANKLLTLFPTTLIYYFLRVFQISTKCFVKTTQTLPPTRKSFTKLKKVRKRMLRPIVCRCFITRNTVTSHRQHARSQKAWRGKRNTHDRLKIYFTKSKRVRCVQWRMRGQTLIRRPGSGRFLVSCR